MATSVVALFISTAVLVPLADHSLQFVVTIPQDWRAVRLQLEQVATAHPGIPVLYRSGFVEQDGRPNSRLEPVHVTPLHPPGLKPPHLHLVPMTYTWAAAARDDFLTSTILPAVDGADEFYFVSSINYSFKTGEYGKDLTTWLRTTLRYDLAVQRLECCRGDSGSRACR